MSQQPRAGYLQQVRQRVQQSLDRRFINVAFRGLFKRDADPSGLHHYLGQLRDGATREDVLEAMFGSTEAARHLVYSPGLRALTEEFWRLRQKADPTARPLCFLHIMKTGGTALTHTLTEMASAWPRLSDLFLDQVVCLPPPLLRNAMLITGHLPLEVVDLLPDNTALCMVLRDPVDRTLSHFGHVRQTQLAQSEGASPSLEDFLSSPDWRPLWENYQARQLVHRIGLTDAWGTFSPVETTDRRVLSQADISMPLQSAFDGSPLRTDPADLLPLALANLERIEFVGVTEELNALTARVATFWKHPTPAPIPRLRVSDHPVRRADVPAQLLDVIIAGTTVDATLYERAAEVSSSRL